MHLARTLLAGAALAVLITSAAQAVVPRVEGKYSFLGWNFCQSHIAAIEDTYRLSDGVHSDKAVKRLQTVQPGEMMVETGVLTFPNTAALSGSVILTTTQFAGPPVKINEANATVVRKTANNTLSFQAGDKTFRIGADTYDATYGGVVGNIAGTLNLIRRINNRCVQALYITRQQPVE